jgi:hypothetical protein
VKAKTILLVRLRGRRTLSSETSVTRPFSLFPHTAMARERIGACPPCDARPVQRACSTQPCARCWRPAFISATRPVSGTPRWRRSFSAHRNKIHIVNLEKTLAKYNEAMTFVRRLAAKKGTILFVGTKRQAREIMAEEATRCGMPYVDERWLGGMLTNFKTIKQSRQAPQGDEAMSKMAPSRSLARRKP